MLNIYPLSSNIQNTETVKSIIEQFKNKFDLHNIPVNILSEKGDIEKELPFAFLILTGGTEYKVIHLIEKIEPPVILLAHPLHNSLPASMEILAYLRDKNIKGKIIIFNDKEESFIELKHNIKIIETFNKMKRTRTGLIGEPSDWLIASNPDLSLIKEKWGPEIIKISMEELLVDIKDVSEKEAEEYGKDFQIKSIKTLEPSWKDLVKAAKVYLALKKIVERHNLQAFTIRCFDLVMKLNTTGCYALSKLTDEGIIAGCEGDLPSTLTMLWMYYLTEEIPFMANPQDININEKLLWIAHCTIPVKMLKNYIIRSHFESSKGVAIEGEVSPDNITLARIGGKSLEKCSVMEGKIIEDEKNEERCRTQLKLKFNDDIKHFITDPGGNHHVLIKGHWKDILMEYYNTFIMKSE